MRESGNTTYKMGTARNDLPMGRSTRESIRMARGMVEGILSLLIRPTIGETLLMGKSTVLGSLNGAMEVNSRETGNTINS